MDEWGRDAYVAVNRDRHFHVKLLLALLAMLTGFSVADGVRVSEPAVAQGEGAAWSAAVAAEDGQTVVRAAAYFVAILLPLVAALGVVLGWATKPAPRLVAATVHASDRSRQ